MQETPKHLGRSVLCRGLITRSRLRVFHHRHTALAAARLPAGGCRCCCHAVLLLLHVPMLALLLLLGRERRHHQEPRLLPTPALICIGAPSSLHPSLCAPDATPAACPMATVSAWRCPPPLPLWLAGRGALAVAAALGVSAARSAALAAGALAAAAAPIHLLPILLQHDLLVLPPRNAHHSLHGGRKKGMLSQQAGCLSATPASVRGGRPALTPPTLWASPPAAGALT